MFFCSPTSAGPGTASWTLWAIGGAGTCTGVVLFALAGELAALVGSEWNLEVVEAHHKDKVDAPSGTARRLAPVPHCGWGESIVTGMPKDGGAHCGGRACSKKICV